MTQDFFKGQQARRRCLTHDFATVAGYATAALNIANAGHRLALSQDLPVAGD